MLGADGTQTQPDEHLRWSVEFARHVDGGGSPPQRVSCCIAKVAMTRGDVMLLKEPRLGTKRSVFHIARDRCVPGSRSRSLHEVRTAADCDARPRHVPAAITDQEADHVGDVRRLGDTAERRAIDVSSHHFLW